MRNPVLTVKVGKCASCRAWPAKSWPAAIGPLPTCLAPVAPGNDLRTDAVLNEVRGEQPDGRLISCPADMQVGGADQNFIVVVGANHSVWQVFRQHEGLLCVDPH